MIWCRLILIFYEKIKSLLFLRIYFTNSLLSRLKSALSEVGKRTAI